MKKVLSFLFLLGFISSNNLLNADDKVPDWIKKGQQKTDEQKSKFMSGLQKGQEMGQTVGPCYATCKRVVQSENYNIKSAKTEKLYDVSIRPLPSIARPSDPPISRTDCSKKAYEKCKSLGDGWDVDSVCLTKEECIVEMSS